MTQTFTIEFTKQELEMIAESLAYSAFRTMSVSSDINAIPVDQETPKGKLYMKILKAGWESKI
jgi:hypothetical protein